MLDSPNQDTYTYKEVKKPKNKAEDKIIYQKPSKQDYQNFNGNAFELINNQ